MADTILSSVILGLVEGVTEYLPVSSTGHLILTNALLGLSGEKAKTYDIVIQLGAILAVVVLYWRRFLGLVLPGKADGPERYPRARLAGLRGLWLLFLTSLPASLIGLVFRKDIKAFLFNPASVAISLAVGAVMMLVVESLPRREPKFRTVDDLTPAAALGVGFFQCLSLWPGFSRSASTIMGAMLLGTERRAAAEYSFLAAVPVLTAATLFEFAKSWSEFTRDDLTFLAVGFVVAFFSAWVAVKGFIHLLQRFTLKPFAWYRLALAPAVWFFWPR